MPSASLSSPASLEGAWPEVSGPIGGQRRREPRPRPRRQGNRRGRQKRAMPGAEDADPEPGADPRLRLLGAFVARSLRPAAGAWERCAGTAEAERLLRAFLGREDAGSPPPLLVVRPGPGGLALRPALDAAPEAAQPRAKGLYFLRTGREPPAPRSLRGAVLCGDVPAAPLEHLAAWVSQVRVGSGGAGGRGRGQRAWDPSPEPTCDLGASWGGLGRGQVSEELSGRRLPSVLIWGQAEVRGRLESEDGLVGPDRFFIPL